MHEHADKSQRVDCSHFESGLLTPITTRRTSQPTRLKTEKELESQHKEVRLTDESYTGLSPQGLLLLEIGRAHV